MSSKGEGQVVAVTGATGFIATWVVKYLLEDGYTVHGTVRSTDPVKVAHLTSLPGAADRLKLFEADLLQDGAFDAAFDGCVGVYHTASPFVFKGQTEDLIAPAVDGTIRVLQACSNVPTVKRVVLTSSTAAVYMNYGAKGKSHVWSEDDWSDEGQMREKGHWYALSKTLAERAAWDFMKTPYAAHFNLSVMNPTLVLGPKLQPGINTSTGTVLSYLDGSLTTIEQGHKTFVDVRDVARAHILAMESAEPVPRVLLIGACDTWETICELLRKHYPTASVPTAVSDVVPAHVMGAPPEHPTLYTCAKAEGMGLKFRDLPEMVQGTVDSLVAFKEVSL